jgi:hypothetical protein
MVRLPQKKKVNMPQQHIANTFPCNDSTVAALEISHKIKIMTLKEYYKWIILTESTNVIHISDRFLYFNMIRSPPEEKAT